jgi:hypothetical protein
MFCLLNIAVTPVVVSSLLYETVIKFQRLWQMVHTNSVERMLALNVGYDLA